MDSIIRISIRTLACGLLLTAQVRAQFPAPPEGPWIAPPEERENPNPVKATVDSLARGAEIFKEHCAACHGPEGRGDGPQRQFIAMNPANLADPAFAATRTDGEWFWKITTGRVPMNPYEDYIEPEDRWHVVNFVRSLSKGREVAAAMPTITPDPTVAATASPSPTPVPPMPTMNPPAETQPPMPTPSEPMPTEVPTIGAGAASRGFPWMFFGGALFLVGAVITIIRSDRQEK